MTLNITRDDEIELDNVTVQQHSEDEGGSNSKLKPCKKEQIRKSAIDSVYFDAKNEKRDEKRQLYMHKLSDDGKLRRIDYVLIYKPWVPQKKEEGDEESDEEKKQKKLDDYRKLYFHNLKRSGLKLEKEKIIGDQKVLKIHAPTELLFQMAEEMRMKMPLYFNDTEPPEGLRSFISKKFTNVSKIFNPPLFPEDDDSIKDLAEKNPYNYFTAEYQKKYEKKFAIDVIGKENFFTVADRIRVVRHILDNAEFRPEQKADEALKIEREEKLAGVNRMIACNALEAAFPLHEGPHKLSEEENPKDEHWINFKDKLNERQKLYYVWASPKAWYKVQPMDPIRRYFGEKIAIYFSWLGYYTLMLLLATIVGLLVFVYGLATMGSNKSADQVCNKGTNANMIMCPICDSPCKFWLLKDSCTNVRMSYIFDNNATVIYAMFVALWATLFLEFWKRTQNQLQYEWDLFDFEDQQETLRPEFEEMAHKKPTWSKENPVTKTIEPFMPSSYKIPRMIMSLSTVLFMVCVVVAAIVGVILYRAIVLGLLNRSGNEHIQGQASAVTSATAAAINLIFICIFSSLYQKLAIKLTDLECPRTETEYEDSYTLKMFVFQFINFYSSIIYIAFFKGNFTGYPGDYNELAGNRLEQCQPGGCLLELSLQLLIIMVGKQFMNNVMEIGKPVISQYMKRRSEEKKEAMKIAGEEKEKWRPSCCCIRKDDEECANGALVKGDSTPAEKPEEDTIDTRWEEDMLLTAQEKMNLFPEYLEMIIQFGFTTLFATAFPLAPLFAFINNIIEIRLDAFKFVTELQRPWTQKAQDIGSWYDILEAVGILSVLFNALIIATTSSYVDQFVYDLTSDSNSAQTIWEYMYTTTNVTKNFANFKCSEEVVEAYSWKWKSVDECKPDICYYQSYRVGIDLSSNDNSDAGSKSETYWKIVAAKFIFVLIFEHVVFFIKLLLSYLVPDMPGDIKLKQLRGQYLIRTHLYTTDKKDSDEISDDESEEELMLDELDASNTYKTAPSDNGLQAPSTVDIDHD